MKAINLLRTHPYTDQLNFKLPHSVTNETAGHGVDGEYCERKKERKGYRLPWTLQIHYRFHDGQPLHPTYIHTLISSSLGLGYPKCHFRSEFPNKIF